MKVLYDTILKAIYIGRPNRFVVTLHRASRQAGCEDEISRGRHRARWRCYHARYKLQQRCGATFD